MGDEGKWFAVLSMMTKSNVLVEQVEFTLYRLLHLVFSLGKLQYLVIVRSNSPTIQGSAKNLILLDPVEIKEVCSRPIAFVGGYPSFFLLQVLQ